jgi:hypothetical protein
MHVPSIKPRYGKEKSKSAEKELTSQLDWHLNLIKLKKHTDTTWGIKPKSNKRNTQPLD